MCPTPTGEDSRLEAVLASAGIPSTVARHDPHAVLFCQGDPCPNVMYLEAGRVRLDVLSPDGTKAVCGIREAGAFLGDEALAGLPARRHTAIAMCDTAVLVIAKPDMVRALHTVPAVSDLFMAHAVAYATHLEADLADQLLHSCAERLARLLLRLSGGDGPPRGRRQVPHLSQEILAEMIGTTRSRVNVLLSTFKERRFIEARGGTLFVSPTLRQWVTTFEHSAVRRGTVAAIPVTPDAPDVADARSALN